MPGFTTTVSLGGQPTTSPGSPAVVVPAAGSFTTTVTLTGSPVVVAGGVTVIPATGSFTTVIVLGGQPSLIKVFTVSGSRVRSGSLIVGSYQGLTISGSRTRSGYLMVATYSSAGALPAANSFRRWRFDDPQTGAAYVFPMNPNVGGSASAKRTLTSVPTTAADGQPLIFEGEMEALTGQFGGTLQTKAQYDAFKTWFTKRYPILLTDDLGRRSYIVMTKFSPKRKWSSTHSFRQTYTMDYKLLKQVDV